MGHYFQGDNINCDTGYIEPSTAPWASLVLVIPKKNGDICLVIDYRRLNQVITPYPYVMLRIEDLLETMSKSN